MRRTLFLALTLGISAFASAQNATPPAGNSKPTDIDPAVNTSSPEQAPARETPRPQDVDPAVNTSSPSQTPGAAPAPSTPARSSTSPSTPAPSAAAPSNAAGSANTPGAPAARSPGASKPAGSATAQGAASTATGASTQNTPASAANSNQAGKPKGKALDRLELDTTQITGNRELPKVLYIVPWKRSDLGDLVGKPVNSLLDEVLTPVDRDVFKRENRYYRALTPAEGGNSPAPVSGNATPASTSSGSAAPASRDER